MALGHIAPCAITMPKKYQKYIQKYIPKYTNKSCIYLYIYIYIYIWIYLAIFFGMVTSPKKIPKYNQIYTNIYKIYKIHTKSQAAARRRPAPSRTGRPGPAAPGRPPPGRRPGFCIYFVHLVYICIYVVIFWYFFWCRNQFFFYWKSIQTYMTQDQMLIDFDWFLIDV